MSGPKGSDFVSQLIGANLTGDAARFMTQQQSPADINYQVIYADNFRALAEMSRTRFDWFSKSGQDLPETFSPFHAEQDMFYYGSVLFFRDDVGVTGKLFALRAQGYGRLNMYNEYTRFQVTAPNFKHIKRTEKEAVMIYSNASKVPDVGRVVRYAQELTDLDVTFRINAMNARRTRTAFASEDQKLAIATINDSINRGDPVVFLNKASLDAKAIKDAFEAVDFGIDPKHLIDLHIARQRIWADAMTRLGVDNANQDKKERVNEGEVEANDAQIGAMRQSPLQQRKQACELINERFGLDLDVRYHEMSADVGSDIPDSDTDGTAEVSSEETDNG